MTFYKGAAVCLAKCIMMETNTFSNMYWIQLLILIVLWPLVAFHTDICFFKLRRKKVLVACYWISATLVQLGILLFLEFQTAAQQDSLQGAI